MFCCYSYAAHTGGEIGQFQFKPPRIRLPTTSCSRRESFQSPSYNRDQSVGAITQVPDMLGLVVMGLTSRIG
jgi:hypothetical protein